MSSAKQISICTVRGWILKKLAMMVMAKHGTEHSVEIAEPYCAKEGKINFYLDIFNTYKGYKREGGTHVGFFTHRIDWQDPNWLKKLDEETEWSQLDGIITMTTEHTNLLHEYGYQGKIEQIVPGNFARSFRMSPLKLLIAQRGDESHYGKDFVIELLDSLKPDVYLNLEFGIVGDGWDEAIMKMRQLGITVENWKDSDINTQYPASYQQWYDWCDYVFIPIHETGGPMCYMEALACGKPVLGTMTGLMKEGSFCRFDNRLVAPGDVTGMTNHLRDMLEERKQRRDLVKQHFGRDLSWDAFAKEVVEFIAEVDNACQA